MAVCYSPHMTISSGYLAEDGHDLKAPRAFSYTASDQYDCWADKKSPLSLWPRVVGILLQAYPICVSRVGAWRYQCRNVNDADDRGAPTIIELRGTNVPTLETGVAFQPSYQQLEYWTVLDRREGLPDYGAAGWSPYFLFEAPREFNLIGLYIWGSHAAAVNGEQIVSVANIELVAPQDRYYYLTPDGVEISSEAPTQIYPGIQARDDNSILLAKV